MRRTAVSLMRHDTSATVPARIAMNTEKLSADNPPPQTVIATPDRTPRRPSRTNPHAASEPTVPMHAIQRWMSGRRPGRATATITDSTAAPASIASGSSARVRACVKFTGASTPGDPRGDLEPPVADHRDDRARPDAEEQHRANEWDEHGEVEQRHVADPCELIADGSEEHAVGNPEQPAGRDDDGRHDEQRRDAMLGERSGEDHEIRGETRERRDPDDAERCEE